LRRYQPRYPGPLSWLKNNFMMKQLFRYGLVTILGYVFIFGGTAFLVEIIKVAPNLSYFIILTLTYVGVYIANTKYVFGVEYTKTVAIRYVLVLIALWLFNTAVFNFFVGYFNLGYLVAVVVNILIFGLLRFFIQKNFVFKPQI
jgi:hypothetical protein